MSRIAFAFVTNPKAILVASLLLSLFLSSCKNNDCSLAVC